jgi:hypothetical protein
MIDGFVQQFARPGDWPGIRADILQHAERFFALGSVLKQYQ